jgi:hypothetical protein
VSGCRVALTVGFAKVGVVGFMVIGVVRFAEASIAGFMGTGVVGFMETSIVGFMETSVVGFRETGMGEGVTCGWKWAGKWCRNTEQTVPGWLVHSNRWIVVVGVLQICRDVGETDARWHSIVGKH